MSIPFFQSLRALRHDSVGFGRWLALTGVLLLGAWLAWFLRAQLPVYENSTSVSLLNSTEAEALFAPPAADRVRPGQEARLYLETGRQTQPAILPATVTAVTPTSRDGALRVQLALQPPSELADLLTPGRAASVEIRVAHFTPAQRFLQAAGNLR